MKKTNKKLNVSTERVRILTAEDAQRVAGGATYTTCLGSAATCDGACGPTFTCNCTYFGGCTYPTQTLC